VLSNLLNVFGSLVFQDGISFSSIVMVVDFSETDSDFFDYLNACDSIQHLLKSGN
jgi:predicted nucleotidyltransferase